MNLTFALTTLMLAAADGGTPGAGAPAFDNIKAPLGHIGDSITAVPPEGFTGTERVFPLRFPGCGQTKAVWAQRFLLGAAVAGVQVQEWLSKQPALKKKLFGKADPLPEAILRSRRAVARANACTAGAEWKLSPEELSQRKCEAQVNTLPSDQLFEEKGKVSSVVRVFGADEASKNKCLPRLSAILGDGKGVARFALHADYGGALSAEVYGDKCQLVTFTFDEETQSFAPAAGTRASCPAKKAKK